MPLIPYPDVPNYPGVPQIPRNGSQQNSITIKLSTGVLILPQSQVGVWAIFNSSTGADLYTPQNGADLSFLSYGFSRSMAVSDFPIEAPSSGVGSGFSSYNKVFEPANPIVTLSLSGPESEQARFLAALDAACGSTDLYVVQVPDTVNASTQRTYTVESYSYRRSADRGATLLMVEISFREIKQTTATLTNVLTPSSASVPVTPQSPSAVAPVNAGTVQPNMLPDAQVNGLLNLIRGNSVGVPN
ncbi:MAG: hypothetical protein JRN15_12135 [Nitrososphaerota archaeon]|nr:hypothetical protein [Nitrososphaerota archaeon]